MISVLVVDDDFMVARLHSSVVAREPGFRVVGTASTGGQALASVKATNPDLVLLDVYLPDMTGLEVLRRLRDLPGTTADVIVISAARDADTLRQALHGGVFQYLVKPFEIESLRRRLQEYAAHRSAIIAEDQLDQSRIDRVFRAASAERAERLPKNISPETVQLVMQALKRAAADGLSATECAEVTGLSRSSTRRYLDHLVATGEADVRPTYGTAGRPERRYRLR